MKIIYVHADRQEELNTAIWRCFKPAAALNQAGHEASIYHWRDFDHKKHAIDAGANVVVFQRYCWNDAIRQVQDMKRAGITTVYDFDDDHAEIPETNSGYPFWNKGEGEIDGKKMRILPPKPLLSWKWIMKEVDIVTTSSYHLAYKYDARVLENMPTLRYWKRLPRRKSKTKVIGWGGGSSHLESWRDSNMIAPLLAAAVENKWNIRIVGSPSVMMEIGKVKQDMKRKPMCMYRDYMKSDKWPSDLSTQFDLFVIPLHGEYDKARSPIKAMECGLAGVPWIATDNGVYENFKQFGTLVKNDPEMWYRAIVHAMRNNEAQKQAALSTRNYILEHFMVENNIDTILETYKI